MGAHTGATEIGAGGVYIFGCSDECNRDWSCWSVFFWALRRGATEIKAVGEYIFKCSGEVQPKSEVVECISLGAQTGCTRNWSWWNVYFWVPRRVQPKLELAECIFLGAHTGATKTGAGGVYIVGCADGCNRNWCWWSVNFWVPTRVQSKLELAEYIFLGAQTGATEIGAGGVYIFGCAAEIAAGGLYSLVSAGGRERGATPGFCSG